MSIGHNIRQKRLQKGLTLEDVANLVGVSRQTLSRYENDKINIPIEKLKLLSAALGTTPSSLIDCDYTNCEETDNSHFLSSNTYNTLSEDEQSLLALYRSMPEQTKKELYSMLTAYRSVPADFRKAVYDLIEAALKRQELL